MQLAETGQLLKRSWALNWLIRGKILYLGRNLTPETVQLAV